MAGGAESGEEEEAAADPERLGPRQRVTDARCEAAWFGAVPELGWREVRVAGSRGAQFV